MKLIQTFDIEDMSINSLKPSITSEPEGSLDTCIKKDVDCLIPKDKHSQSNGQDLPLTNFDLGIKEKTAKNMFEQVCMNSKKPEPDTQHAKDPWNSETTCDNSSEKENMDVENDKYDVSDVDSDFHLKISSDDENTDCEQNDSCNSSSKNEFECKENGNSLETDEKVDSESLNETSLEKDLKSGENCNDGCPLNSKIDANHSDIETKCETSEEMVNEELHTKMKPLSETECSSINSNSLPREIMSTSISSNISLTEPYLNNSDLNTVKTNKVSATESEKTKIQKEDETVVDSNNSVDLEVSSGDLDDMIDEQYECSNNQDQYGLPIGNDDTQSDHSDSLREELMLLADEENEISPHKEQDSDNKEIPSETKDSMVHATEKEKDVEDMTDNVQKDSPSELKPDDVCYDKSPETVSSLNEEESGFRGFLENQGDSTSAVESKYNSGAEEDFLEILEYQPAAEEEELRENSSEKSVLATADHNTDKPTVLKKLCSASRTTLKDSEESEELSISEYNVKKKPVSEVTKLISNSNVVSVGKITNNISKNKDVTGTLKCEDVKGNLKSEETTNLENSEVKSRRKRSSNSEEILVNHSKRTKVISGESDEHQECEVLLCENDNSSDLKTCTDIDTKEKLNAKNKRLSNNKSDKIELKKSRIIPESSSDQDIAVLENIDISESAKNEDIITSSRESSDSDTKKYCSLPFFRNFNRTQLRKLSRNDLEELVIQKICEAITERAQCGELRNLAQSLERQIKGWQKKSQMLTKQIKDLNGVLRQYANDLQRSHNALPKRITRAVGLQVQMTTIARDPGVQSPVPKAQHPSNALRGEGTVRLSSQGIAHAGTKSAAQAKLPASSSSLPSNANKGNKQQSHVNNKLSSTSDHQVIDLTDNEEKAKSSSNLTTLNTAVNNGASVTSFSVPIPTTVVSTTVSNSPTSGRSFRVLQHFGGTNAPILTQAGSSTAAGQRVTYLMPKTNISMQQRPLIISSTPQVHPTGGLTMSQQQNPLPTILLKQGQVVPITAPTTSIIRTSAINNSLHSATSRVQARTGQVVQRLFPAQTSTHQSAALSVVQSSGLTVSSVSHPAPLPPIPSTGLSNVNWKLPPPKPDLKISKVPNRNQQGIVLSWNLTVTDEYENIASYQLFAYQEGNAPPSTHLWKKVGDVMALPLPMACTLTQFMEGHKYHFAVRAVDVHARCGPFSAPGNIVLTRN